MADITVTVITVVYNAASTIEHTIQSVLAQSYNDIEYIIIDGGSIDGTLDIIYKYCDKLAYFVSEPDNGIYDAMNKGIQKATGDIIGLLNADDWYEQGAIDVIVREFKRTDADVIGGETFFIDKKGKKRLRGNIPLSQMWKGMMSGHQAIFITKKAYDTYGLYDTSYKIAADYEIILRMYHRGAKIVIIDDILVNYSTTGISATAYVKTAEEHNLVIQKYMNYYPEIKEKILLLCRNRLENAKITYLYERYSNMILLIFNKLQVNLQNKIVIWGTGIWGTKIAEFCCRSNIRIDFFVDTDEEKQEHLFCGMDVKAPAVLEFYDGVVFIAVKNYDVEIAKKLVGLNNSNLQLVLLSDFINAAMAYYDEQNVKKIDSIIKDCK